MLVDSAFLWLRLTLRYVSTEQMGIDRRPTVKSLTRVDFPAPLGPIMPTRLINTASIYLSVQNYQFHLDSDIAQLTLCRLGVERPG